MNTPRFQRRLQLVAGLFTASLLAACAAPLTEDQFAARDYDRFKRHQAIKGFIAACKAGGFVVFYTGPSYQKLREPVKHIPSGAHLSDYQCVNGNAVSGIMKTGG